jgi:predicted metal-dependent phosphotriesterase family hydrolase
MRDNHSSKITRRDFLKKSSALALGLAALGETFLESPIATTAKAQTQAWAGNPKVQTVLGPISPDELGVTLMHEHAPIIDWSELYGQPPAPINGAFRRKVIEDVVGNLEEFHKQLKGWAKTGTIVECTPIRVGRYPDLIVEMARKTNIHVIACTSFWCEDLAPMHPWAVSMLVQEGGIEKVARLHVREITEGMEDPYGKPGESFTDIRAGIMKPGTSKYLTFLERRANTAVALASVETGCPISFHTAEGGGLEVAQLLLSLGVDPKKIIIGHQGYMDDRKNVMATDYHKRLAGLGVWVQFDRIGYEKYPWENRVEFIKPMVDAGFEDQLLISHDAAPYFYTTFWQKEKRESDWLHFSLHPYTLILSEVVPSLMEAGISKRAIRKMLIENPKKALAF